MKTGYLTLRAFLLTLVCSTAFAEQQAFVTIDPNLFAPGQNISNATTGAQLLVMRGVPNPDPNAPPERAFVLQYSPTVYAQPVDPGCALRASGVVIPCAPFGNLMFGYTGGTVPVAFPDGWYSMDAALPCLEDPCSADIGYRVYQVLRVNFTVPTDRVNAVALRYGSDNSAIYAFNSGGEVVGACGTGSIDCATLIAGGSEGWWRMTIARNVADISYVVIAGIDVPPQPIAQIQFDSPVSLQLAGLLTKVQGVGPGKSLANQVMAAQTYYSVPDIQATCATLSGFTSHVGAQTGKSIANQTAAQLLATAQAIEIGIHCQ